MTLIKDKLGSISLNAISQIRLSSSAFLASESELSSGISINDKVNLTDSQLSDGLACLKKISQASHPFITSEEEERKRISRELHDGLGQILTSMGLHVQRCLSDCDATQDQPLPTEHRDSLEAISSMVKQAMSEVRSICSAIRPAILDDLGVLPAISWQCRQITKICSDTQVVTDFDVDESSIPEDYKSVIYRIVQESLNNAVKYAKAKTISVSLLQAHDAIHLMVIDDGIGFDPSQIQGKIGMGLVGMRERAESVDGRIRIDTGLNQGVQIRASFPI
ncbi:MAG: sensor histidine kinase [Candidatus Thiodiazotropha sp. 6PDIVS]